MFFIVQKRPWCRYRRLWKILCFLSKLPLFSSFDSRTDVCGAIPAPAKNPHTVGIWGLFWPVWCRSLTCNHFLHLKSPEIYHILWYSKSRFSADFLSSWGNSSTLEKNATQGRTRAHRASFTVNNAVHILSLPIAQKSRKCPTPLDIPPHKSLYTTSGFADFK